MNYTANLAGCGTPSLALAATATVGFCALLAIAIFYKTIPKMLLPLGITLVFAVGFSHAWWTTRATCLELSAAMREDACVTYTGIVHVVRVEPPQGHVGAEIIRIRSVTLEFSHFSMSNSYHQTLAYGGFLSEGTCVSVCVYRGRILTASTLAVCSKE